jgi:hypothetical protein
MLSDFDKYVDVVGLAVVNVRAGRLFIGEGRSYLIVPPPPAAKLLVAEELSFHPDTLLPARMTFVVFCPSSQTFRPAIDSGVNELGIGAAETAVDARLAPIALIAFRYTVYTVPFVRPVMVRGVVVCTGLNGINVTPLVE